jgi:hypothetical protein
MAFITSIPERVPGHVVVGGGDDLCGIGGLPLEADQAEKVVFQDLQQGDQGPYSETCRT